MPTHLICIYIISFVDGACNCRSIAFQHKFFARGGFRKNTCAVNDKIFTSSSFCCFHISPKGSRRYFYILQARPVHRIFRMFKIVLFDDTGCNFLLNSSPPFKRLQSVTIPSIISLRAVSPPVVIKFSMISPFLLGLPSPWLLCIDLASPPRSPELLPSKGS
jgi:hypothetical protein